MAAHTDKIIAIDSVLQALSLPSTKRKTCTTRIIKTIGMLSFKSDPG